MNQGGSATVHNSCACVSNVSLLSVIRRDVDRCRFLVQQDSLLPGRFAGTARTLVFYPALYGVISYRLAHAAWTSSLPPFLRSPLVALTVLLQHLMTVYSGVEMSARAHTGPGLFVNHSRGVVIGAIDAGENLTVSHGVTLGQATGHGDGAGRCPVLGDRVWLGVGCVVTGPLRIGDDAVVGANAVVLQSVPDRGVAVGVPARVVSRRGGFDRVLYRGMDLDAGRAAALLARDHEPAGVVEEGGS